MRTNKLAVAIKTYGLTPGADLTRRVFVSESSFMRWANLGWVEDRGHWVLTKLGYKNN